MKYLRLSDFFTKAWKLTKRLDSEEILSILGWLSLAAMLHRYSGSSETALDKDLKACRGNDPIGDLLTNLRESRKSKSLLANANDFTGGLVDKSGLLALYIACKNKGILDFFTEGKVILQAAVDRHHILPRAQFPEKDRAVSDTIANIAFISGDGNRSIGSSGPEVYIKNIKKRILESQCIPLDKNLWLIEKSEEFWEARRELLAESFNEYIKESLPDRRLASV